jgi:hypothetical protein
MDETASDVKAESEQPENQENNEDGPKHGESSLRVVNTLGVSNFTPDAHGRWKCD